MKMNTATVAIQRSEVLAEATFQILASAKAFEILSGGLYKDAIGAIVRELPCNAHDALVAAGKTDVPFTIHLPTSLEPYFSVKDDGLGLSDNDIQGTPILDDQGNVIGRKGGLYTTYFASTKTDSNDSIGAFGLGCKSPYSYSEMFQVTSRFEGRRRVYTMYLNEQRLPAVALMSDMPTDECNGLEVRVDVKEKDFYTFRDRACTGLRFFKVKPIVTGQPNFKFADLPNSQFSGDRWMVSPNNGYSSEFTAVMGQVPYRVDVDKLVDHLPNSVITFVRTLNIITYFDIGELEVPPDREEVRYSDETLLALISRVTDIRKQFTTELEKRCDALEDQSFWSKYQSIRKISQELFRDEKGIVTFLQGETSNADLLRYCEAIKNRGLLVPTPLAGHIVTVMNNATGRRALIALKHSTSTIDRVVDEDTENGFTTPMIYINPNPSTLVVYSDVRNAEMKRLRLHMATLRHTNQWPDRIVVIQRLTERRAKTIEWEHELDATKQDQEFAAICDAIGNPKVVRLSSVKNVGGGSYVKRPLSIYKFSSTTYRRRVGYVIDWSSSVLTDEAKEEGGLYFLLDRGKQMIGHGGNSISWGNSYSVNMNAMIKLINSAQKTTYKATDVVGVSTLTHRRIKDNKNWKNVFEVAASLVNKYSTAVLTYRNYLASEDVFALQQLMSANSGQVRKDIKALLKTLDSKSLFRERISPLVTAYESLVNTDLELIKCVHLFEDNILRKPAPKTTQIIKTGTAAELRAEYPMLTFVSCMDYNKLIQLFEYVSIIDRSKV